MQFESGNQLTTVILSMKICGGRMSEFTRLFYDLDVLNKSMNVQGAVDTWMGTPADSQDTVVVFTRWTCAEAYCGWLNHPERALILEKIGPFISEPPITTFYHGSNPLSSTISD